MHNLENDECVDCIKLQKNEHRFAGADRYVLFCGHMLILIGPSTYFRPTQSQGQISPLFGTLFHRNLQNNNIDLPMFDFFLKEACTYTLLPLSPLEKRLNQI